MKNIFQACARACLVRASRNDSNAEFWKRLAGSLRKAAQIDQEETER